MSFETLEISRFLGRPVHLFTFARQSLVWRYASGGRDVTIGGNTYTGAQVSRSEIQQSVEGEKNKLTITLPYLRDPAAAEYPATQPLGNNWHPYIPSDPISITCRAMHYGDASTPAVEWSGVVTQTSFSDTELTLTCEQRSGRAQARNQGAKVQRACWKTVYSTGLRGCNLQAGPIALAGTVTAITGSQVTASAYANPPRSLVGGTATWTTAGPVNHTANITAHTGSTITLDDVTGITTSMVVTANTVPLWINATLSAASGVTATAAAFGAATLQLPGGWLEWTRLDGLVERRSIIGQSGNDLTLLYGAADLAAGLAVRAIPGCPQTWDGCDSRSNTINFGGAIYKRGRDPKKESMSWG